MPIRFRCAYCNQLMGISRRKAGTVVRCPSCSGQVVVPNPSSEPTEKPHEGVSPRPAGAPELFERSDFDELFDDAAGGKRVARRAAAAAAPHPTPDQPQALGPAPGSKPAEFAFDVEPVPLPESQSAPAPTPGIVLSPRTATLLIVAIILALSLVFIVGMVVGSLLHGSPSVVPSTEETTSAFEGALPQCFCNKL
jgi:DNA-directed RNA polymerase subunit RPC12/RpoP